MMNTNGLLLKKKFNANCRSTSFGGIFSDARCLVHRLQPRPQSCGTLPSSDKFKILAAASAHASRLGILHSQIKAQKKFGFWERERSSVFCPRKSFNEHSSKLLSAPGFFAPEVQTLSIGCELWDSYFPAEMRSKSIKLVLPFRGCLCDNAGKCSRILDVEWIFGFDRELENLKLRFPNLSDRWLASETRFWPQNYRIDRFVWNPTAWN